MKTGQQDVYQRVTNQIIEAIERGAGDWKMPWHQTAGETFVPINAQSKKPYRGINILSLWAAAEKRGFSTNLWATYKQWQELGANVRKAAKATLVVFWKFSDLGIDEGSKDEEPASRRSVLARGYSVFNEDQVDGFTPPEMPAICEVQRVQTAENFFSALGADIRHGGDRACYSPETDYIQLPRFEVFQSALAYYSTLAHEATHWTGAVPRLNRELSTRFGGEAYAAEELIAELGAAFLCAELGLSNEPRPDHAAYVASWLRVLKNDKRAIFTAASKAQAAVDYMHGKQVGNHIDYRNEDGPYHGGCRGSIALSRLTTQ